MAFDVAALKPSVSGPDAHGTVTLTYDGRTLRVRFTWTAIALLQQAWGEEFFPIVQKALEQKDLMRVSHMLGAATNYTADQVRDLNPPILPAVQALTLAWQVAWTGGVLAIPSEEPEPEKSQAPATLWGRLVKLVSGQG